jgi:hypothetical protein
MDVSGATPSEVKMWERPPLQPVPGSSCNLEELFARTAKSHRIRKHEDRQAKSQFMKHGWTSNISILFSLAFNLSVSLCS